LPFADLGLCCKANPLGGRCANWTYGFKQVNGNEKGNLADRFGIYPDTKHKQGANHLNT